MLSRINIHGAPSLFLRNLLTSSCLGVNTKLTLEVNLCTNTYEAEKSASLSVEEMVSQGIGRCHPLKVQEVVLWLEVVVL